MLAGLPGYALAGWMDNVPPRFLPQTHQSQRTETPQVEAPDVGLTTGSISAVPRRPAAARSAPPPSTSEPPAGSEPPDRPIGVVRGEVRRAALHRLPRGGSSVR